MQDPGLGRAGRVHRSAPAKEGLMVPSSFDQAGQLGQHDAWQVDGSRYGSDPPLRFEFRFGKWKKISKHKWQVACAAAACVGFEGCGRGEVSKL